MTELFMAAREPGKLIKPKIEFPYDAINLGALAQALGGVQNAFNSANFNLIRTSMATPLKW